MNNFKELLVWQKAMILVVEIYKISKTFPKDEKFGLTQQIRRCSVSIPSNIAEGAGRKGKNEFTHFLSIALGSCFELETQLILSKNLEFIPSAEFKMIESNTIEVQKMINGLQKSLNK